MQDAETNTEWSHILGKGMRGQLTGRKLKPLITDMVTWSVWKQQHPDTTVLNMSRTTSNYSKEFYRQPKNFVFGFEANGESWALPMNELIENPVHSFEIDGVPLVATFESDGAVTHLFSRVVDGRTLTFQQVDGPTMKDRETNSIWSLGTGKAINGELKGSTLNQRVGIMSFRRAWVTFHPDSQDVEFDEGKN